MPAPPVQIFDDTKSIGNAVTCSLTPNSLRLGNFNDWFAVKPSEHETCNP